MSEIIENYENRKIKSSNLTVVVSITLILLMMGTLGILFINVNYYTNFIKEQLAIEVFFKDNQDSRIRKESLEKNHLKYIEIIKKYDFVKDAQYISKQEAAQIAKKELGLQDLNLFEEDIYPASVNVILNSEYFEPKLITKIKKKLAENQLVDEVVNDNELMVAVYQNINKISAWLIGISLFFLLIVVVLINNSIRLKIYSKRFIIKTMQLVGAKRIFILQPFLLESFKTGLISSLFTIILLGSIWYYLTTFLNIPLTVDYPKYYLLAGGILLIGIGIAMLSTLYATWRFLHIRTDELYYS
jgi:cell division transport system permease protein